MSDHQESVHKHHDDDDDDALGRCYQTYRFPPMIIFSLCFYFLPSSLFWKAWQKWIYGNNIPSMTVLQTHSVPRNIPPPLHSNCAVREAESNSEGEGRGGGILTIPAAVSLPASRICSQQTCVLMENLKEQMESQGGLEDQSGPPPYLIFYDTKRY